MSTTEKYQKIAKYIDDNPIATLSTINDDGTPHGAIVYVISDSRKPIAYFLTKNETRKFKNLAARTTVGITIYNEPHNSTLQASGTTFVVKGSEKIDTIMKKMIRANALRKEWIPPVSKLSAGHYVLVGIELTNARLAEFEASDKHIFTEI